MQWWKLLDDALESNGFPNHYLQLATVREDGSPAIRTLVYRGRNEQQHLLMVSDARSEKFAQLIAQPQAEICWYFYDSREQFRFTGEAQCIIPSDQDPSITRLWQSLSQQAKQQYFWPNPGIPINDESDFDLTQEGLDKVDLTHPPMHFCVIKMVPIKVDYLKLIQPMHRHWRYDYDVVAQEWRHSILTP